MTLFHVRFLSDLTAYGVPQQDSSNQEVRSPVAYLRVTVTAGGTCRFSFSQDNGRFASVGDEFVARPGVWVGAKVGVFSVARPGAAKLGHADWEWFRVEPQERPLRFYVDGLGFEMTQKWIDEGSVRWCRLRPNLLHAFGGW